MKGLSTASVLAQTALLAGMSEPEVEGLLLEAGYNPQQTGLDRRGFLKAFSLGVGAVAGAVVLGDVEKALWMPGAKTFFLPPEKGPIISGDAAVGAFKDVQTRSFADALAVAHEVSTSAGTACFDAHWNLLSLGGQSVSSMEAARLQSSTYSAWWKTQPLRHSPTELRQLAREIRARRALAGIPEPS